MQPESSFSNITLFFMAVGLLWGLIMDMGMFAFAAILAGFWFSNGINGLLEGRISNWISWDRHLGGYIDRKAEPFFYWFIVAAHFLMAGMIVIYCLRKFH